MQCMDDSWDRGCVLGDECLFPDPFHSSDDCYNAEMAKEFTEAGDLWWQCFDAFSDALNQLSAEYDEQDSKDSSKYFRKIRAHKRLALNDIKKKLIELRHP